MNTGQQKSLHPCTLDESSLSIGRVKPSNAKATSLKALGHIDFRKPFKPCHIVIHYISLAEYSQMSTHVQVFPSFSCFSFVILYWPK